MWGDPRQAARQRQLFYVPESPTDVIYEALCTAAEVGVVTGCTATTSYSSANAGAAQFATDMEAYIDQYGLSKYRGRIVPRNSHTSSWLSVLDLRMSQELPIWRKARGILTFDIENFANMIDKDWGQLRQVSFAYFTPVVDVNRIDSATNRYVYRPRSGFTGPGGAVRVAVGAAVGLEDPARRAHRVLTGNRSNRGAAGNRRALFFSGAPPAPC